MYIVQKSGTSENPDLKVQEVPKGPRDITRSKIYLKVPEVPKCPRGT